MFSLPPQSIPGGFNALARMYTEIQEPMMDAAQESVSLSRENRPRSWCVIVFTSDALATAAVTKQPVCSSHGTTAS